MSRFRLAFSKPVIRVIRAKIRVNQEESAATVRRSTIHGQSWYPLPEGSCTSCRWISHTGLLMQPQEYNWRLLKVMKPLLGLPLSSGQLPKVEMDVAIGGGT